MIVSSSVLGGDFGCSARGSFCAKLARFLFEFFSLLILKEVFGAQNSTYGDQSEIVLRRIAASTVILSVEREYSLFEGERHIASLLVRCPANTVHRELQGRVTKLLATKTLTLRVKSLDGLLD